MIDIYTSTIKNRPAFVKTNFLDTGDKYEGLPSERDIDKHRVGRKMLSPAFSARAMKQYESVIHGNIFAFTQRLEEFGQVEAGVNITEVWIVKTAPGRSLLIMHFQWFEWVTTDLGGAITLGHNYGNVQRGELLTVVYPTRTNDSFKEQRSKPAATTSHSRRRKAANGEKCHAPI